MQSIGELIIPSRPPSPSPEATAAGESESEGGLIRYDNGQAVVPGIGVEPITEASEGKIVLVTI